MRMLSLLVLLWVVAAPTSVAGRVAGADPSRPVEPIHVSTEGPIRSIGDAVAMAASGGRIVVAPGTYREDGLRIDRPLTIEGSGEAVLVGSGERTLITITADSVRIRGLVLRRVETSFVEDRAGIKVDGARHCELTGNVLEDTFFGIYLAKTSDCVIAGNRLLGAKGSESRSGNGIHLWYSKDVRIIGNSVEGHRDGIYLEFVEDSRVDDNVSRNNHRYGLHFMFSDRCAYASNRFENNDAGVAVMYTREVTMTGNTFVDNWGSSSFGLLLKDITDSRVTSNRFTNNTIGIYAEGSNRIQVVDNVFERNGWAVKVMANAEENVFRGNDFIGNSFDVATNSRQTSTLFEGNYWDSYQGYDLDRDGTGDVPFRPVALFSLIVERNPPAMVLMRSFFVDLLDAAERIFPVLTPEALADAQPRMHPIR